MLLELRNDRYLDCVLREKIYSGENKITSFRIMLPDQIGDFSRSNCQIELRAYVSDTEYLSYNVPTNNNIAKVKITTDITEKPQTVNLMCVITHDGNVIGKTNFKSFKVLESPEEKEPLTPREQLDTVIAEQRQIIAKQEEIISEKNSKIEEDTQIIENLNNRVSTLSSEKAELQNQHNRDVETIASLNSTIALQNEAITTKNTQINDLTNTVSELTAENEELEEQHTQDVQTIEDLTSQLNTSRLINIDMTVDNLDFFDSLSSDIAVSGTVYVDGIILLTDKQRVEEKYPNLTVTAEYIIDFANFMLAITGGVVVDSDNNVLTFSSGGAYQSVYSANDIDKFIDEVNEQIEKLN